MNIQHRNERYFALSPQDKELWLLGINNEYCWDDEHSGGWNCVQCRLAITLPAFFAAASYFAYKTLESAGEV